MPTDATGTYTLVSSFFVQNGDTVLPVQHNPPFLDVAAGLTNRLMKDGRTVMTGNLQMGGFTITGMASNSLDADVLLDGSLTATTVSEDPSEQSAILAKISGARAANTATEVKVDGVPKVTALADQERAGLLRWDATTPIADHQGDAKDAILFPPNDGADGAYVKVITRGLEARDFDVKEAATGGENSARLQKAVDYAVANDIGLLTLPYGVIQFDTQVVVTAGADTTFSLDIEGNGNWRGTTLKSNIIGAATGGLDSGFLLVADGMRFSEWRNFQIDFSTWAADPINNAGAGAILARCRNQSLFKNTFRNLRLVGGTTIEHREPNKTRGIVFLGNESEATSAGWATYFNEVTDCSFNTAYKHIEMTAGDGGDGMGGGTSEPNANQSRNCLFERYIIAIDLTGIEESQHIGHFFQAASGVSAGIYNGGVAINGGFTDAIKANGFGHLLIFSGESGPGSRGYNLGAASSSCMVIVQSNFAAGNVDSAAAGSNTIIDRGRGYFNRMTMYGGFDLHAVGRTSLPGTPRDYEAHIVTNPLTGAMRPHFWDPVSSVWRDFTGATGGV